MGEFEGAWETFWRKEKFPSPPQQHDLSIRRPLQPLPVTTCQQGGFHGMDGLSPCGILSFFNKARFTMKLLEKARAAG